MTPKFKLVFTPAAIEHIRHITAWYNEQKKGLGRRFKDNLKKELTVVKKNPFTRSFRYDEVRYAVAQFPYAAHYTIEKDTHTIIIHAIFAFKEDPDKWVKKHR